MEITLYELADKINGKIYNGNRNITLSGTCAIERYIENRITFARDKKFGENVSGLRNAVILIPQEMSSLINEYPNNTYIVVPDVDKSMMDMQDFFYGESALVQQSMISPSAWVAKSAKLGDKVYIGENAYVGENTVIGYGTKIMHGSYISDNVVIGKRTCIHPLSTCDNCIIGDDTVIRTGARIGVDGFRFAQNLELKEVRKMIHVGAVEIGSRVEVGANSVIQRSTFEGNPTIIGDDVKIACMIVVGHNTKIGARTIITCHVMICGRNNIGDDVWIGASAVISNGVTIGNRAKVLINAVVINDVPNDGMVSGFYAMPHRQWKQVYQKISSGIE